MDTNGIFSNTSVSVCEKCVVDGTSEDDDDLEESQGGNDDDDDEYDGDEDSENEIDLEDEDDNQVVSFCCTSPPAASSSSSEEFSNSNRGDFVKRKRENIAYLSSEDDVECSSVQKHRRKASMAEATDEIGDNGAALHHSFPSSSEVIIEKLGIIHHRNKIYDENKFGPVFSVSSIAAAATTAFSDNLLISISSACPNLTRLRVSNKHTSWTKK